MALVVCYFLVCVVRMTMPGIDSRSRSRVFVTRAAFASLGIFVAYGFFWLCTHRAVFKDPHVVIDDGEYIAKLLFCFCVAVGEYLTRRQMRKMKIFPANKPIPWTY